MPDFSPSDTQAVIDTADRLQIDPKNLAAVLHYESNFDPRATGPSGKGYPVRGLIGFDPENVRRYGEPGSTIAAQMPQVEQYLLDRGWKPGAYAPNDLGRLYSIINAGGLDKNGQPYWNRRDINGSITDHVGKIRRGSMGPAQWFLAQAGSTATAEPDLISDWLPKKTARAPAAASSHAVQSQSAPEEDLVSAWLPKGGTKQTAAPPPTETVDPFKPMSGGTLTPEALQGSAIFRGIPGDMLRGRGLPSGSASDKALALGTALSGGAAVGAGGLPLLGRGLAATYNSPVGKGARYVLGAAAAERALEAVLPEGMKGPFLRIIEAMGHAH